MKIDDRRSRRGCAPSSSKLAEALELVELPDLALNARRDRYHDFLSPFDLPMTRLVGDLRDASRKAYRRAGGRAARESIERLIVRVKAGEFDATKEEAAAWRESDEGKDALRRLAEGR